MDQNIGNNISKYTVDTNVERLGYWRFNGCSTASLFQHDKSVFYTYLLTKYSHRYQYRDIFSISYRYRIEIEKVLSSLPHSKQKMWWSTGKKLRNHSHFLLFYCVYIANCFVVAMHNKRIIITSRKFCQGSKVFHQCPKVGKQPLSHATGLLHANLLIKITMYISGVTA